MSAVVASKVRPARPIRILDSTQQSKWAIWGFIAVLSALIIAPLIRLQGEAFANGGEGFVQAYSSERIVRVVVNTMGLAAGSVVVAMVVGTALAWTVGRLPRGLGFLKIFPVLPIVLPAVANVVAWAFLLSPRPGYLNAMLRKLPWWSELTEGPVDVYSLPWIVIITGFSLSAFVYLFVSSALPNISSELIEAARMSGSSERKVFFTVVVPLLRPSLIYAAGVTFLLGLGQFTAPLLLGTNKNIAVMTTEMYYYTATSPAQMGAAAALGAPLLIIGVLVVLAQMKSLGEQRRFVTHGGKAFRTANKSSWGAAIFVAIYALLSSLLPLAALILVAMSRYWTGSIDLTALSLRNFRQALSNPRILESIYNSLVYSLVAMAIALVLGMIASGILVRGRNNRAVRTVLDFVIALPLGIPAVIFGVGFLLVYSSPPLVLYGTPWVLILVYVTLMIPFAVRMQLATLIALGDSYTEASKMSGAGTVRTYVKVLLPLMRSSLGGAAALIFVLLTHEFSASVLVRSSRTEVMGTVLFDYWVDGGYPLVAAIALVMTVVTAAGVVVALTVGGASALRKL